jgi:hypothetical protein
VWRHAGALAPAYPPLSGDPLAFSAAPLLSTITRPPRRNGLSRPSRSQWNVMRTSRVATRKARRVLPTPPRPARVKSDEARSARSTSSISAARPTAVPWFESRTVINHDGRTVDGVTECLVGEAKYGSSYLKVTRDALQMSAQWIESRLGSAVGTGAAAIRSEAFQRVVVTAEFAADVFGVFVSGSHDAS